MQKKIDDADNHDHESEAAEHKMRQSPDSSTAAQSASHDLQFDANFATPSLHREASPKKVQALGLILLLVVSMFCGFLGGWLGAGKGNLNGDQTSAQREVISSESQLISKIAKDVSPSVVSINVLSQGSGLSAGPFGIFQQQAPEQSAGTGIIISSAGLIVTNRHVVPADATSVSVTLSDGTELNNVQVIGRSQSSTLDIAFLKINDNKGKTLKPAVLGDSSKIQVGERVVAIGNALGQFQNTVTSGIISGYGRSVQASDQGSGSSAENLQDMLQTDAAINEGNSGGPLVNMNGEVIGINTAIAGSAQDIGFAIPVNDVSGLIKRVLSTGKLQMPYLGVRYVSLTNDVADQLKLKNTHGAYILPPSQTGGQPSVLPGSPAEKAGLQAGDIILAVNGTAIDERHSLTALLDQYAVGDKVSLKLLRGDKQQTVSATLDETPASADS